MVQLLILLLLLEEIVLAGAVWVFEKYEGISYSNSVWVTIAKLD